MISSFFFFFACTDVTLIEPHKSLLLDTLEKLGFSVNFDESALQPTGRQEYTGSNIDTERTVKVSGLLYLVLVYIKSLRHDIALTLKRGYAIARCLARIAGKCVSMARASPLQNLRCAVFIVS